MFAKTFWFERQIVVLNVVGSNPTGHPGKTKRLRKSLNLFVFLSNLWYN